MIKRTEWVKLSSAGLLLLLTAAAMTLFVDLGAINDSAADAASAYQTINR
ncbi:MAG: hypothetical protein Tsb0019_11030 [Roseibium sp.]